MKTYLYRFPVGASVHFRGVAGLVTAVDRPEGNSIHVILDPANSVPGKNLIIEHPGRLQGESTSERFHEMQIFATPGFAAGNRTITRTTVRDELGRSIPPAASQSRHEVGLELELQRVAPGPNLWLGWMVAQLGRLRVDVLADGKVLKSRNLEAVPIPEEKLQRIAFENLVFTIHTDNVPPRNKGPITIGDVVSFGFTLEELSSVETLELRIASA